MTHKAVDGFINALREWNDATNENQATDLLTLSFLIHYEIGHKNSKISPDDTIEAKLNRLEERIIHLIEKENIREIFLISSLVNFVTLHLRKAIERHGDLIIFHEKLRNENPDIDMNILDRLKSPVYHMKLKNDYFRWQEIVSNFLSDEQFENWDRELSLEKNKKHDRILDEMATKYGDMTMREIYEYENKDD